MTLQTAPNSAVPAYRKKPAFDSAEEVKGHAAGVLHVAPDGHVLLLRRSGEEANFAHHWALPGGSVDAGETAEAGAEREVAEETGTRIEGGPMKLLDRRRTPTGMVFHTFARPVAEKFAPTLNAEHSGYCWSPLDKLPQPMHPAVASTLRERVGMADDMAPADWDDLRDGFLKWTREEEAEPEHAADSILFALDRDTVRTIDADGRLHVAVTNISKATVNPYRGKEIPNAEALGLGSDAIYHLLRPADELEKAAPTFNGIQVLQKHVPVNADDHQPYDVVGATGTDAVFEAPYLRNSITIWTKRAIEAIENDTRKELSCGYRYRAEMTPGIFDGMRYDGVMRDIVGNHVALVKDGRAGPDVVVGDSKENVMATKPTRLAAVTLGLTAAAIAPLLAMDSKIELPKNLFTELTSKNIGTKKTALLAGVRSAIDGKLRKGLALDASMEHVGKVMDAVSGLFETDKGADESASEAEHNAMEAAAHGESNLGIPNKVGQEFAEADKGKGFDAEPLKAFLKEKGMGDADIAKACDMMPKNMAGDESEEDKKKREDEEAKKKAAEDSAKAAKDAEMKDMVSKPAMDAALKATEDAVTKRVRETERGIREAVSVVRPWTGELSPALAFDSADDVYRHAAVMMNVPGAKDIHPSALRTIIEMQPKPGAHPVNRDAPLAMDAAQTKDFAGRFPGTDRIGAA